MVYDRYAGIKSLPGPLVILPKTISKCGRLGPRALTSIFIVMRIAKVLPEDPRAKSRLKQLATLEKSPIKISKVHPDLTRMLTKRQILQAEPLAEI